MNNVTIFFYIYIQPSCIIQPRPPDKRKRQVEYCLQLDDQVNKDQQALKQLRERKEKIEEDQQKDLSKRFVQCSLRKSA